MATIYRTITEQVADQVREKIYDGQFKENDLLREQELSDMFQVSRGTVRHALMQLVKEGIVTTKPNIGMKVASHPTEHALDIIISIRVKLEEEALFFVWDSLRDAYFEGWERIIMKMEVAAKNEDIRKFMESDMAFHRYYINLYPDKHIRELWEAVLSRMMMRYNRLLSLEAGLAEHRSLMNAVRENDKEKAKIHIEKNIV